MGYSVGQVAALARVTVRTLHHYHEIGLLAPGRRTDAGYRTYTERDLERLQQILFYRELGFPLEQIKAILDGENGDAPAHLETQLRLLRERIERLQAMAAAVERTLEATQMGTSMTPEERFEVFGNFEPEKYEQEAQERWGATEAFRESQRKVSRYTKADWQRIKAEGAEIQQALVAAMQAGRGAPSADVMELAERHRQHISRWFYECSHEVHRGLGEMYVADPRFTAQFEEAATGLAAFMRDAIAANADRAGSRRR